MDEEEEIEDDEFSDEEFLLNGMIHCGYYREEDTPDDIRNRFEEFLSGIEEIPRRLLALRQYISLTRRMNQEYDNEIKKQEAIIEAKVASNPQEREQIYFEHQKTISPKIAVQKHTLYCLVFCEQQMQQIQFQLESRVLQTSLQNREALSIPKTSSAHKITLAEGTTAADIERIFTAMQQAGIITTNVTGERIAQMFFAEKSQSLTNSYDKAKSIRNGEAKASKNSERLRKFAEIILRDLKPK